MTNNSNALKTMLLTAFYLKIHKFSRLWQQTTDPKSKATKLLVILIPVTVSTLRTPKDLNIVIMELTAQVKAGKQNNT